MEFLHPFGLGPKGLEQTSQRFVTRDFSGRKYNFLWLENIAKLCDGKANHIGVLTCCLKQNIWNVKLALGCKGANSKIFRNSSIW